MGTNKLLECGLGHMDGDTGVHMIPYCHKRISSSFPKTANTDKGGGYNEIVKLGLKMNKALVIGKGHLYTS